MRLPVAEDIARHLGGEWFDGQGQASCPLCQPERRPDQRALHIEEMFWSVQLFCRAGGCPAPLILRELRAQGLLKGATELPYVFRGEDPADPLAIIKEAYRRSELSAEIWEEAQPVEGSAAEAELHALGLVTPETGNLRFHPACWHPHGTPQPALVGSLNQPVAGVHLWYLPLAGRHGGPPDLTQVRLGGTDKVVQVAKAEPVEQAPRVIVGSLLSGLALASGLLPGLAKIWVALSPAFLPRVWLPEQEVINAETGELGWSLAPPGRVIISRDGTTADRHAAETLAARARSRGWDVSFLTAPKGQTWLDVLRTRQVRDWGGSDWAPGGLVRVDLKKVDWGGGLRLDFTGAQIVNQSPAEIIGRRDRPTQ